MMVFSGCAGTIPPEALQWNKETLKQRQLQTRKFDTQKEGDVLSACAALLQDLGFALDESASPSFCVSNFRVCNCLCLSVSLFHCKASGGIVPAQPEKTIIKIRINKNKEK
jgi:hypothetical protein